MINVPLLVPTLSLALPSACHQLTSPVAASAGTSASANAEPTANNAPKVVILEAPPSIESLREVRDRDLLIVPLLTAVPAGSRGCRTGAVGATSVTFFRELVSGTSVAVD